MKREKKRKKKKKKRRRGREDQEVWMLGFWFGTIWFCMDFLSRYMFVGCGL